MIIRDGPFQGSEAPLRSTPEGDWVEIEGEVEFRVGKGGKIIFRLFRARSG